MTKKVEKMDGGLLIHGTLVDVFGVGVLIVGKSGIGKSETALDLVQRGHRLAADDAVFFKKVDGLVLGSAPDLVRYMMEIRGLGLINIWEMFGSGAVKLSQELDMVIELEDWDDSKDYSRQPQSTQEILKTPFPKLTIPVKQGRNLATIVEVAAKNYRLRFIRG